VCVCVCVCVCACERARVRACVYICIYTDTASLLEPDTTVLELQSLATVPNLAVILKLHELRLNFKLMFIRLYR
jgi:hypothetical protein